MAKSGWMCASVAALVLSMQGAGAHAQAANGVGSPFELAYWQSIGPSDDPALYEAYLQQYPQGTFAALARARAQALRRPGVAAAPSVPAVAAVPPLGGSAPAPAAAPVSLPAPAPAPAAPSVGPALALASPVGVPGLSVSPAAAVGAGATLGQMLADLARTQETPVPGAAPAPLPAAVAPVSPVSPRYALPPHPQMAPVPDVALPASFCSAEDRNRFHDSVYRPAVDAAKRNNDAAVAYLRQLQGIYDGYNLGKDTEAMNALAAEARAYQADAATTFSQQAALVRAFDELMAVPVTPCTGGK